MGKWTRRAFIGTGILAGGTLLVGVAIRPGNRSGKVTKVIGEEGDAIFDIWLKISPENVITVIIPHSEMGQGVHTSLAMMIADELDADWSKVVIQEAPAYKEYANHLMIKGFLAGDKSFPKFMLKTIDGALLIAGKAMNFQLTGGSASVRFTGDKGLRVAGAATRMLLKSAAAEEWHVPVSEITTKDSYLYHTKSGNKSPYASFAQAASEMDIPDAPPLKTNAEFTIMGTDVQRDDIPLKVKGEATFGIDTVLPGMLYATVQASPVFGSQVASYDESAAMAIKGVKKIINIGDAVAAVADGYWTAKKGIIALNTQFTSNLNKSVSQDELWEKYKTALMEIKDEGGEDDVEKGDFKKSLATAKSSFEAAYRVPFLAHTAMEPMNCTVWIHDGKCEVWTGSQNPLGFASLAAEVLEIDAEDVIFHNQFLGGGFGRRAETDAVRQAVLIAKELDKPVKMIWSREEDVQQDFYREASMSQFRATLDSHDMPIGWSNQYLFKHHPPEASQIPYNIPNQDIRYTNVATNVPWGNWRSVDHSTHGFFIESFIDELAHYVGKDPYQYRRDLLNHDAKFSKVLDLAAEKSNWGSELPPKWGRGIAIHKSFGTIVCEVVEVEIKPEGTPIVHRVTCVADPGLAIHPNGFIAQMESGIVYGLTAALYGEINIQNGAVKQSNFHDYQMLRINEMPEVKTYIVNSEGPIGGGGEPGTPPIGPALANAIFAATGTRIRELPVQNHDLSYDLIDFG